MSTTLAGRFGSHDIEFEARVDAITVPGRAGRPGAEFVYTSYCRANVPARRRPVIFAFNGGPGSSSAWVHLGLLGPQRVAHADDLEPSVTPPFDLVDNTDSPLDVADIVLIDPPGTGYSRLLAGADPADFHGVRADAVATLRFIAEWCRRHRRQNSPKFLQGESYGSLRAALVARMGSGGPTSTLAQEGIEFSGVILIGPAFQFPFDSSDIALATSLPSLAATAWFHQRVPGPRVDLDTHVSAAQEFAGTQYLTALFAGDRLPAEEQEQVARRLHELIGIPPDLCREHRLRIDAATFSRQLLADVGRQVGIYDSRYVLAREQEGSDPVGDDPAMSQYTPGFVGAMDDYLRSCLRQERSETYRTIDFSLALGWDFEIPAPGSVHDYSVDFAAAMRRNRRMEMLVCTGLYDLGTTVGGASYAVARGPLDSRRVHLRTYESGHMPYLGAAPRRSLSDDIRAFVSRLTA